MRQKSFSILWRRLRMRLGQRRSGRLRTLGVMALHNPCFEAGPVGERLSEFCAPRSRALAPKDRRATAYGSFNAGYGIAWFAGSGLKGILYDISVPSMVMVSFLLQALALPFLWWVAKWPPAARA